MRFIAKKAVTPPSLEAWLALANADWQPSYESLQNPQKRELHAALLDEQGSTCCYCGRVIDLSSSHIEHFRPQEHYPDLGLAYFNLHASCLRETAPGMPLHCGHAKGSDFNEDLHISPLTEGCESRYIYTLMGAITPRDERDVQAAFMSGLLKLDINFLRNHRREALSLVFDPHFLATASTDELQLLRERFLEFDHAGCGADFGHVISRYAEQLLS